MSGYNLEECLQSIPPTSLSYQEFIEIGMALKSEGLPFEVWDSWARQDYERYKGTLRRKWDGFSDAHAAGSPVAGGHYRATGARLRMGAYLRHGRGYGLGR